MLREESAVSNGTSVNKLFDQKIVDNDSVVGSNGIVRLSGFPWSLAKLFSNASELK